MTLGLLFFFRLTITIFSAIGNKLYYLFAPTGTLTIAPWSLGARAFGTVVTFLKKKISCKSQIVLNDSNMIFLWEYCLNTTYYELIDMELGIFLF